MQKLGTVYVNQRQQDLIGEPRAMLASPPPADEV